MAEIVERVGYTVEMPTPERIRTEARRRRDDGIRWLDTYGPPDWRSRVDIDTLEMASGSCCVLGQVFGSFQKGFDLINDGSNMFAPDVQLGFQAGPMDMGRQYDRDIDIDGWVYFDDLNAVWTEYCRERTAST